MAAITIRKLDPQLKHRLRLRAAAAGTSMEEEARRILRASLAVPEGPSTDAYRSIRRHVEPLGGVELAVPAREPMRDPPPLGP